MIDLFSKIATALQPFRLPVIVLGVISLAVLITTIFGSKSHAEDYFLIPSAVGLLWSFGSYGFIVNFTSVPQSADPSWSFFKRLKRHMIRTGYRLLGVVFIVLTAGIIFTSYRMVSIWLKDYTG